MRLIIHDLGKEEFHSLFPKELSEISKCEALVFAFPLYVDGIPSHMLRCLLELEGFFKGK